MGFFQFAFLSPESQLAAEASECAADQDAFWEYHDILFENQDGFTQDNLVDLAGTLNLDLDTFSQCLESGKYTEAVEDQIAAAQALGVRSTPSFLVNGRPLVGAQPLEVFEAYFEVELNQ